MKGHCRFEIQAPGTACEMLTAEKRRCSLFDSRKSVYSRCDLGRGGIFLTWVWRSVWRGFGSNRNDFLSFFCLEQTESGVNTLDNQMLHLMFNWIKCSKSQREYAVTVLRCSRLDTCPRGKVPSTGVLCVVLGVCSFIDKSIFFFL